MEGKNKEKVEDDTTTLPEGELLLKRLREMPYNNDKVGKSFAILHSPLLTETQNSETEE